jgi:hypothetical protein
MDPIKSHLAVLALLTCFLAGCGGGGKSGTTSSAAGGAAKTEWAAGMREWSLGMRRAIDGISVIFSRPADVRGIQAGDRRVGRTLRQYEQALANCSARVRRLGPPPEQLQLSQHEALHACKSLEHAAALIATGVAAFQRGLGPDVLNTTAEPLSAGEDGVRRAELDLVQS